MNTVQNNSENSVVHLVASELGTHRPILGSPPLLLPLRRQINIGEASSILCFIPSPFQYATYAYELVGGLFFFFLKLRPFAENG